MSRRDRRLDRRGWRELQAQAWNLTPEQVDEFVAVALELAAKRRRKSRRP